jgi:FlaA1/EpsC-like NDP-sugar epimerase
MNPERILAALRRAAEQLGGRRLLGVKLAADAGLTALAVGATIALADRLCNCGSGGVGPAIAGLGAGLLSAPAYWAAGLYRPLLRVRDSQMPGRVMRAAALGTVAGGWLAVLAVNHPQAWVVAPIGYALVSTVMLGWRIAAAAIVLRAVTPSRGARRPIIVYGAGQGGARFIEGLRGTDQLDVVAVVDDDPALAGRTLQGVTIHPSSRLPALVRRTKASQVVLAMPSISFQQRLKIIDRLARIPIEVATLPPLEDIVAGRIAVTDLREVTAEDLLARAPIEADIELIGHEITGRRILVTGAGGSIGSAICHQVVRHSPARIVVLDQSEYALYRIDQELRGMVAARGSDVEIVPVLGSVLDEADLDRALGHGIDVVYHAAAYKHVPLVEANALVGVENTVFGTIRAAEAARRHKVARFVMISTDKAVRPTSVMGASKRVAEQALVALAGEGGAPRTAIVRFGNVLDSAGSVVPLFRDQIRRGGPVTVTHPEVTRYFMTIPEAAELVIQAGAMAGGAVEVFHLDMGEPVKILDLARRFVQLSGRTVRDEENPDGDIEIAFVGLRPGEKLYEELLVGATSEPTRHPRIFRAPDAAAPADGEAARPVGIAAALADLTRAVATRDEALLRQALDQALAADFALAEAPTMEARAAG